MLLYVQCSTELMYESIPRATIRHPPPPPPPLGNPRAFDLEQAPHRRAFDFVIARTVGHLTMSKTLVKG